MVFFLLVVNKANCLEKHVMYFLAGPDPAVCPHRVATMRAGGRRSEGDECLRRLSLPKPNLQSEDQPQRDLPSMNPVWEKPLDT